MTNQLKLVKRVEVTDEGITTDLYIFEAHIAAEVALKKQRFEVFDARWFEIEAINLLNCSPEVLVAAEAYRKI